MRPLRPTLLSVRSEGRWHGIEHCHCRNTDGASKGVQVQMFIFSAAQIPSGTALTMSPFLKEPRLGPEVDVAGSPHESLPGCARVMAVPGQPL